MIYEIYNPNNTYVTEDGNYVTPEQFALEHNAVNERIMAVGLTGRTIVDVKDFDYLRAINGIANSVEQNEALNVINKNVQLQESESTPIERIAASLEYIVIHLLNEG